MNAKHSSLKQKAGHFILLLFLFIPTSLGASLVAAQTTAHESVLYLFWGDGCPHCAAEKVFLEELSGRHPELKVEAFEIYHNEQNRELFKAMATAFGKEPQSVPTTIVADNYWVGFSESIAQDIEAHVAYCTEFGDCPDPKRRLTDETLLLLEPEPSERRINLPFVGSVNVAAHSLTLSTALIALVDGFNPCSLWVLSILLAVVLHTGSRKKVLWIGSTFLLIAALAYGLFIAGLFSILSFVAYLKWIQLSIALVALTFAVINIKDYFWYKQGVSLTIADAQKPRIYKGIRNVMSGNSSFIASLGATSALAFSVTLIELPCTAGLPMLWTSLVAEQQVSSLSFVLLLGLYLLIFILDELILFASAVISLKVTRLEEKQGRLLKLLSGMVMLALAGVMLVAPDLMQNLGAAFIVFATAIASTFIIHSISKLLANKPQPKTRKPSL